MNVIKRNGEKEPLDISKFRKQIKFGVETTSISLEEFEKHIHLNLVDNIRTSDLQNLLIQTAEKQCSVENIEWVLVAGRVAMWNLYSEVYNNYGFDIDNWFNHIRQLVKDGYYKQEVLDKLISLNINLSDIDLGTIKNISKNNHDFDKVISRVKALRSKNIMSDKKFNLIEYPFLIYIANAALLADDKEEFLRYYKRFNINDDLSLGTPFLNNLRVPNGNTGSCYVGSNVNSLLGIMKSWQDIGTISKEGGGIGWYLGFISSSGASHNKVKKTSSKTKWMKIIDTIANTVDQRSTRKAAVTLADNYWQLDVMEFLDIKDETGSDLRGKCFDIFPQIILDSYFVDSVLNGDDIYLFDHKELKDLTGIVIQNQIDEELYKTHLLVKELIKNNKLFNYKKINAVDLWEKILKTWITIGGFYITHIDNINLSNYLKDDNENYNIAHCVNLCTESWSISKPAYNWEDKVINGKRVTTKTDGLTHSCNLISINVSEFSFKTDEEIYSICKDAVYMLTKSIRLGTNPTKESDNTSKYLQNIGIGTLGVSDYMAYEKVMYDTEEGRLKGMKLQETITYNCYRASIELAKETAPYPWFNKNNYDKLFGKTTDELKELSKLTGNNYDWEVLRQDILKYGIANFYLMATAPNTSTGVLMGVGSSYLPTYGKFYYETLMGMSVPVVSKYLKDRYWYYKTRYQFNPVDLVKFTTYLQEFIDTGISMELNLAVDNTDMFDLSNVILNGFKNKKLKAVYYSTSIDTCSDCSN